MASTTQQKWQTWWNCSLKTEWFVLLCPLVLLCFTRFGLQFNGLYGQDSYEYLRYTKAITSFLLEGDAPGYYYWGVYYPLVGGVLGMWLPYTFALQFVSSVSAGGVLVVLHKALQQLSADKALIGVYLVVFVFGSPLLFRASQVAMSDVFGMFCIVCVCYLLLAHTRSAAWWQVPVVGMCFSVGFFTRYVGVLYCIPFLLYWLSKQTGIKTVCILVLVVVVASIPQIVLKQGQETAFLSHEYLQLWSVRNYFRTSFVFEGAHYSYTFPNIIFALFPLVHPLYYVFGLGMCLFFKRRFLTYPVVGLSVAALVLHGLFFAGVPHQNQRHILQALPFVAMVGYLPFQQCVYRWGNRWLILAFVVQTVLCIRALEPYVRLNKLEQTLYKTVKPYCEEDKTIYTFYVDMVIRSGGCSASVVNLWLAPVPSFTQGAIVLFNEAKFAEQWKGHTLMNNWNNLKANCQLTEIDNQLPEGWILYEIR